MKIKNSTFLFIGLIIFIFGIYLGTHEYFKQKKERAYTEMNLLLHKSEIPEIKDEDQTQLPNNNETQNIEDPKAEIKYDYIAEISIPKINLSKGLVSIDSPYNNVDYNITIIGGSKMPNEEKGNLILAAHSGNCYYCYFNQLYRLGISDEVSVYYEGIKYTYTITDIYNVEKNGEVAIRRNKNKNILTLITCTRNSDTEQTVYISELVSTQKY